MVRKALRLKVDLKELIKSKIDENGKPYNIKSFTQKLGIKRESMYPILRNQYDDVSGCILLEIAILLDKDPREIWQLTQKE